MHSDAGYGLTCEYGKGNGQMHRKPEVPRQASC